MNPTRAPIETTGEHRPNGHNGKHNFLRLRQEIIIVGGSLFALAGFCALIFEMWRGMTVPNVGFRPTWILTAIGLFVGGLAIVQTINPMKLWEEFKLFVASRMVGGRRATDPPPETAPPPCPPEKRPVVDPNWRRRRDD